MRFGVYHDRLSVGEIAAYIHLFDPRVVQIQKGCPHLFSESLPGADDVVIIPSSASSRYTTLSSSSGQAPARCILIAPDQAALEACGAAGRCKIVDQFNSLKEYWSVGNLRFAYPQDLQWSGLRADGSFNVHSQLADWPGILISPGTAIASFDLLQMHYAYNRTWDRFTFQFNESFATTIVDCVYGIHGRIVPEDWHRLSQEQLSLCRDFHALGFCFYLLLGCVKLNCRGLEKGQLYAEVEPRLLDAADAFSTHRLDECRRLLKVAFEHLLSLRHQVFPPDVYWLDLYHGGAMLDAIGIAEFDWPQGVADLYRNVLRFVEEFGYKMNLEIDGRTAKRFARRFPILVGEIVTQIDHRRIELVDGAYSSPCTPFYPLESQLRQFEYGLEAFKKSFSRVPEYYARQEPAFASQIPQVLRYFGFKGTVFQSKLGAESPVKNPQRVLWKGPDGSTVNALVSGTGHPEKDHWCTIHLPRYVGQALSQNQDNLVLTSMMDQPHIQPFREELIRSSRYSPVWGRHYTISELMKALPESTETVAFAADDYQVKLFRCPAGSSRAAESGNFNQHFVMGFSAERTFRTAEMLQSLAGNDGDPATPKDHDTAWRALNEHQGHDAVVVRGMWGGQYSLGGRRVPPKTVNYLGPSFPESTVIGAADSALRNSIDLAKASIAQSLQSLIGKTGSFEGQSTVALFNALPYGRRAVVELPRDMIGATSSTLATAAPTQASERGQLALCHLPVIRTMKSWVFQRPVSRNRA